MKKVRLRSEKAGLPPGAFVRVGHGSGSNTLIRLFEYGTDRVVERQLDSIDVPDTLENGCANAWIDIDGLNDDGLLLSIGERFDLHPLLLEDVLNTDHRPKVEEYHDTLFVVTKMLSTGRGDRWYPKRTDLLRTTQRTCHLLPGTSGRCA